MRVSGAARKTLRPAPWGGGGGGGGGFVGRTRAMQIWAGLGNPGAQYALHRHNVGFMAVDAIAEVAWLRPVAEEVPKAGQRRPDRRHQILLLKPQTYHERQRRRGSAGAALLQARQGRADRLPRRARPRPVQGQGEARRRHRRAQWPALDRRLLGPDFRRVRIGIGHPATRTGSRRTCWAITPRARWSRCPTCSARSRPRPNGWPTATTCAS